MGFLASWAKKEASFRRSGKQKGNGQQWSRDNLLMTRGKELQNTLRFSVLL
jgi:hypothetical protein